MLSQQLEEDECSYYQTIIDFFSFWLTEPNLSDLFLSEGSLFMNELIEQSILYLVYHFLLLICAIFLFYNLAHLHWTIAYYIVSLNIIFVTYIYVVLKNKYIEDYIIMYFYLYILRIPG